MQNLIKMLSLSCGLSEKDIRMICATAPSRYKTYKIPKRSGGERIISQPAREVKYLQRAILQDVLAHLPVHDAATAYQPGKSIKDNAFAHAQSGAILKLDFMDFFPSILARDWKHYCERFQVFSSEDDINDSTNILFHRRKGSSILRLAIGAPSSPMLSNILMEEFDRKITELVSQDKVRYTRYADDMTFSAKRAGNLINIEKAVRKIIKEISFPKLKINKNKTVLATKKFRRVVTGLVLTDDGEVSLGRDRKRQIRAMLHHYMMEKLSPEQIAHLSGLIAFAKDVEPQFVERLCSKYSPEVINNIRIK